MRVNISLIYFLILVAASHGRGTGTINNRPLVKDRHGFFNISVQANDRLAQTLWVDMDGMESKSLDHNYVRVNLAFTFPLFDRTIRSLAVNSNGYLSFGNDFDAQFPARYIAPLMIIGKKYGNRETSIKFRQNGKSFTVQWGNLKTHRYGKHDRFTFQATLHENGNIEFVYKRIPFEITDLIDHEHLVKIGMEDLFYLPDMELMYYYVDLIGEPIQNSTIVSFKALPTCRSLKNCSSCVSANLSSKCVWCPALKRCSVSFDPSSKDWFKNKCQDFENATCTVTKNQAHSISEAERIALTKIFILAFIGFALALFAFVSCVMAWIGNEHSFHTENDKESESKERGKSLIDVELNENTLPIFNNAFIY
ncbi:Hypothetical predicted protein [Cloeon dipterum]|uniref:PSI domain-containing protein n=2 Tax=Cloeon dipterum TaxID=197152 RepID=A0A8S1D5K3_9INSE|nr:Hypothetical predicted protein [Cloeon dipterum]